MTTPQRLFLTLCSYTNSQKCSFLTFLRIKLIVKIYLEAVMNEEIIIAENAADEEQCEDSTEVLLEKYDRKRTQKFDDITAMQSVMCILLVVALFVLNLTAPELSEPIFVRISELSQDKKEVIPNIIELIAELCLKR